MQPSPSPVARPVLADILAGISFDMEFDPIPLPVAEAVPSPRIEPPAVEVGAELADEFVAILRANLHAASRHASLGHEGPGFRQCSRAACLDAAKLIPQLEHVDAGATDAELDVILDRVLAALETSLPAAASTSPRVVRGGTSYSAPMPR